MKKSLIALAALAAFGTASAQSTVTISGTYNVAAQKAATGAESIDLVDSNITFTAVEDLGGGMKATISSQIQANGRQDITTAADTAANVTAHTVGNQAKKDGVWGRNASVTLSGGFGAVSVGRLESSNIIEKAIVAPHFLAQGFDRSYLAGSKSNGTSAGYTAPTMSGFTVGFSRFTNLDINFAPVAGAADAELSIDTLGGNYSNGPLTVDFANKRYTNGSTSKGTKNEIGATYTMGPAKFGIGAASHSGAYFRSTTMTGNTTVLSASYLLTPEVTVGLTNARRADGAGITGAKGVAYTAEYALSKRTQLNASAGKMQKAGDTANNYNQYRLGIKSTF